MRHPRVGNCRFAEIQMKTLVQRPKICQIVVGDGFVREQSDIPKAGRIFFSASDGLLVLLPGVSQSLQIDLTPRPFRPETRRDFPGL